MSWQLKLSHTHWEGLFSFRRKSGAGVLAWFYKQKLGKVPVPPPRVGGFVYPHTMPAKSRLCSLYKWSREKKLQYECAGITQDRADHCWSVFMFCLCINSTALCFARRARKHCSTGVHCKHNHNVPSPPGPADVKIISTLATINL